MLVHRRGRPRREFEPGRLAHPEFVDDDFDAGAEDAIALLSHEILMHGAAPLHPDGDRITTYDPVPLVGDNDRDRSGPTYAEKVADARAKWRLPPPKPEPPKPKPWPTIVEWLPADFQWLLDDDKRISQAEIERFWIKHRLRTFAFQTIRVQKETP